MRIRRVNAASNTRRKEERYLTNYAKPAQIFRKNMVRGESGGGGALGCWCLFRVNTARDLDRAPRALGVRTDLRSFGAFQVGWKPLILWRLEISDAGSLSNFSEFAWIVVWGRAPAKAAGLLAMHGFLVIARRSTL